MMARWALFFIMAVFLFAACTSPRDEAADWADRFPAEIGSFELDDRIALAQSDPVSYGHVTLIYEGDDDLIAQLTINAYGSESVTEIQMSDIFQQWALLDVQFERERAGGSAFDIATTPGGGVLYYLLDNKLITLAILVPAEAEIALDGDFYELWIDTILAVEDSF